MGNRDRQGLCTRANYQMTELVRDTVSLVREVEHCIDLNHEPPLFEHKPSIAEKRPNAHFPDSKMAQYGVQ